MIDNVKIGDKTIDWQAGIVIDQQGTHKLEPLPMAFLKFLVEHQGNIVTKEQLLEAVWHNRQVSDDAIRRVVKLARTALGDDAKSPKFIKTVPLRGYILVAEVSANIETNETPVSEPKAPNLVNIKSNKLPMNVIFGLMVILVLVIACMQYFVKSNNSGNRDNSGSTITSIEKLTTLDGFVRQGSFCDTNKSLLFTHQSDKKAFEALYSKDIEKQIIKRLNFAEGDIESPLFSPDCTHIAYTVKGAKDRESFIASYKNQTLSDQKSVPQLANRQLLSWSQDGVSLYFSGGGDNSRKGNSAVISRYSKVTKMWQQITFSLVEGRGDYFALESHNSQYLGVLRNTEGYRTSVLVLDLNTNQIKTERHLPFYANRILWLKNQPKRLVVASRKGDFYYFDIDSGELKEQTKGQITLNDVFYHCGADCFYMRRFDMNYSDVKELPNPFNSEPLISTQYIESSAADFNPVYSPDGKTIYFTKKGQHITELSRYTQLGEVEPLFRYPAKQAIHNLQIGPNERYATGKLGNRVFLIDLTSKDVQFITSEQEQAFYPLFNKNGSSIFFSRLEQDQIILMHFDIAKQTINKVAEDLFARLETKNDGTFLLDKNYSFYQVKDNGEKNFIVNFGNNPYYHWEVSNGYVYFTQANRENVELVRVQVDTSIVEQHVLFEKSRSFHFNIHPNTQKMLVAEYLLPQSDLVKVTW